MANITQQNPLFMIIRTVLFLTLAALAMMMLADLLLNLRLPSLPGLFTQLGIVMLLSAFLLLVLTGLVMVIKGIILACHAYFSASQCLQRRVWFIQAKQDRLIRLLHFRRVQINYWSKLKRKQLLNINDQQQLKALSKEIVRDLSRIKRQLPKVIYVQLQQEHKQCLVLQDMAALLTLQQKIELC